MVTQSFLRNTTGYKNPGTVYTTIIGDLKITTHLYNSGNPVKRKLGDDFKRKKRQQPEAPKSPIRDFGIILKINSDQRECIYFSSDTPKK